MSGTNRFPSSHSRSPPNALTREGRPSSEPSAANNGRLVLPSHLHHPHPLATHPGGGFLVTTGPAATGAPTAPGGFFVRVPSEPLHYLIRASETFMPMNHPNHQQQQHAQQQQLISQQQQNYYQSTQHSKSSANNTRDNNSQQRSSAATSSPQQQPPNQRATSSSEGLASRRSAAAASTTMLPQHQLMMAKNPHKRARPNQGHASLPAPPPPTKRAALTQKEPVTKTTPHPRHPSRDADETDDDDDHDEDGESDQEKRTNHDEDGRKRASIDQRQRGISNRDNAAFRRSQVAAIALGLPKNKDGSKTEEDAWGAEMHQKFVEAVFQIGLKHGSPSVIMEHMTEQSQAVTSERIKSHLQKYRNNRDRSHTEFMKEYDEWMLKALTVGAAGGASQRLTPAPGLLEMMGADRLLGGEVAAFLTYCCLAQGDQDDTHLNNYHGDKNMAINRLGPGRRKPDHLSIDVLRRGSREYIKHLTGARIPLPKLTEQEKRSPLGASIGHVMDLFYSMTDHLMREREAREKAVAEAYEAKRRAEEAEEERARVAEETAKVAALIEASPTAIPFDFKADDGINHNDEGHESKPSANITVSNIRRGKDEARPTEEANVRPNLDLSNVQEEERESDATAFSDALAFYAASRQMQSGPTRRREDNRGDDGGGARKPIPMSAAPNRAPQRHPLPQTTVQYVTAHHPPPHIHSPMATFVSPNPGQMATFVTHATPHPSAMMPATAFVGHGPGGPTFTAAPFPMYNTATGQMVHHLPMHAQMAPAGASFRVDPSGQPNFPGQQR